jgi:hypothetical protein
MGWAQHTAYDFRTGVAKEDIKVDCSRARPPGRPEATIVLSSATVFMRMSGNVARNGDDRRDAQPNDLALQLRFPFQMRALCGGLVGAPPERPGDDVCRLDASLRQPRGNAADLLDRPVDKV